MLFIYDICYIIFIIIYLPIFLLRGKLHAGFSMRFGRLPKIAFSEPPIWIHAVSVGEMVTVKQLVNLVRKELPQQRFVFSTITPTGFSVAKSIATASDAAIFLPLDLRWIVRGVLRVIKPKIFVVAETEIWPNLFVCLHQQNVPIVIVNGRISDRSIGRYMMARELLRPYLDRVSVFCMQSKLDAQRITAIGAPADKVCITGTMKYDLAVQPIPEKKREALARSVGLVPGQELLVAASTHAGEEEIVLAVYKQVLSKFPTVRLLVVPRHPARAEEVAGYVTKAGFYPVRLSMVDQLPRAGTVSVYILDTLGQLMDYYSIADIVFVGGCFVNKGGHNILEPAALGKAVIYGPDMSNFRDVVEQFRKFDAGIQINDQGQLYDSVVLLLSQPEKRRQLGTRAVALITENTGSTQRHWERIKQVLRKQES